LSREDVLSCLRMFLDEWLEEFAQWLIDNGHANGKADAEEVLAEVTRWEERVRGKGVAT